MHSLRVDKHPFIGIKHFGARIDFLTQEWQEGSGIEKTRIWIYFKNRTLAESTYEYLIKEFLKAGAHINQLTHANTKEVTIKKNDGEQQWQYLSIILGKTPRREGYSIEVLFFDDDGTPW